MKVDKISVLGMGYIGLPTAIAFAENGYQVQGFDVNENVIETLNKGKLHIVENSLQAELEKVVKNGTFKAYKDLQVADVYIICVPTPFLKEEEKKLADLSYVHSAAENVGKILKKGDLVILESTVPPGTTKEMTDILCKVSGLSKDDFLTAHCPERVLPGRILFELKNNDRIIGSENKQAAELAKEIYSSFLVNGNVYITDDITAEMCKLVENSFRDVNIAFANELSILCDKINIDVNELITLANKHPRVNILSPGVGVGGHCISVDPWFLIEKFGEDAKIITSARKTNDYKPYYVAHKIEKLLSFDTSKTIAILGLSFKANIDDLRESPSIILANVLRDKGYNVIGCEPNVDLKEKDGIELFDLQSALDNSDLAVVTVKHDVFMENMELIKKYNNLIV
ncbi:nucleotide sugar dehydrogenase [Anaerofustis butyriciformans]|uniref:nucleotide sugar dehydrogenase n=1 Tax=Anaerofustis butyriciformans TaxID=3108533 RepID=UPI002E3571BD|nr:nucleotide sugar dehydrogenase [Anaerofustis sp. HA2171]